MSQSSGPEDPAAVSSPALAAAKAATQPLGPAVTVYDARTLFTGKVLFKRLNLGNCFQCPQSGEKISPARGSRPQSRSSHSRSSCWKPTTPLRTVQLQLQAPGCSYFHASNIQYASPCCSHASKPRTGEVPHLLGHM